jgi:tRNA(Phe) wybutosine-synthesizing methylase Tyw3
MVDSTKVVCNLTAEIQKLDTRNKVQLEIIQEISVENQALKHIVKACESQLKTSGSEMHDLKEQIAGYKKVLADNGFQV